MKNEKGFSVVELIIILVIVGLIGAVGWLVYDRQNDSDNDAISTEQTQQTTNDDSEQTNEDDETRDWLLYSSKNNEYKIRLADGLIFEKSEEDSPFLFIFTDSLTTKEGTRAQVVESKGGRDGVVGMFINYFETGTETKGFGDKQSSFKTNSGLSVDKYLYMQVTEPDGIGLEKGGKEYTYYISHDNADLTVSYSIAPAEEDKIELIEKMVKTIEML